MLRKIFCTLLLMCLSAESPRMTDVKQQITIKRATSKTTNENLSEKETSLATQPWEFIKSFFCHLHAKFPCFPSTEFPLALSALISIG